MIMIAVATTMPMIWQMRTCSVADQPVVLEQILVATERMIIKAMIPKTDFVNLIVSYKSRLYLHLPMFRM
jgi:hypothetical protein